MGAIAPTRRTLLAGTGAALLSLTGLAQADETNGWPESATAGDLAAARQALEQWTEAYRAGDFDAQWSLTDPAIRRWKTKRRWNTGMKAASRRNGALQTYEIQRQSAVLASSLPCTEQRHCFHKDIRYVAFVIASTYKTASPPQPEYAVMAWSEEGWRFGGGTFLNRPLGETAVILTEEDERLYTKIITRVPRTVPDS
ncbi:MAG: hypothetical protein GC155_01755 [Alphaproteobacteria bacterium]|nr:hypothetical protein [Alphaproteobacteria bacterium]